MEYVWLVLGPLITGSPLYLVWIAGMAAVWIRRQQLPGAWPLLLSGLIVLLVSSVGGAVATALVPVIVPPGSANFSQSAMSQAYAGLTLVRSLAAAIGHAMILVGLFRLARKP